METFGLGFLPCVDSTFCACSLSLELLTELSAENSAKEFAVNVTCQKFRQKSVKSERLKLLLLSLGWMSGLSLLIPRFLSAIFRSSSSNVCSALTRVFIEEKLTVTSSRSFNIS